MRGTDTESMLRALEATGARRAFVFTEPECGLRAFLVIDDVTLGPAAGGIRTLPYASPDLALADAARLARAMTLKCSIAGLDAGGGKMVVIDHPGLDRERAFRVLGDRVQELGGLFLTGGDAGTRHQDLLALAERTRFVRVDEGDLSGAVAAGLLHCLRACAEVAGHASIAGLRVAVQGCGAIGSAVCRLLAANGVSLLVADIDDASAQRVAAATGARVTAPSAILTADVDVVAPCALGGVIDEDVAANVRAWAVCGAANNILASPAAGEVLRMREILHVPDIIASAGAAIHGICSERGDDRAPRLIEGLGGTAREVLLRARAAGVAPTEIAHQLARARIERTAASGRRYGNGAADGDLMTRER